MARIGDRVRESHMKIGGSGAIALGAAGDLGAELDWEAEVRILAMGLHGLAKGADVSGGKGAEHEALRAPTDAGPAEAKSGDETATVGNLGVGGGLGGGHEQSMPASRFLVKLG